MYFFNDSKAFVFLKIYIPSKGLRLARWIMYCIPSDRKYNWFVINDIIAAFTSLLPLSLYFSKYFGVTQNINLCKRKSDFCKAMCFLKDIPCICQAERPTKR